MRREEMLARLQGERRWDILVVGGGATGLGIALDAASRGYRTLLVEQADFAKGTSSRSTKLIHGGLRYLRQGQIGLVREALREREILLHNAPHLVQPLSFHIPCYSAWEHWSYRWGVKVYDWLAGRTSLPPSRWIPAHELCPLQPNLRSRGLQGAVCFTDAQFDDSRLALALAQTACRQGAVLLNYCALRGFFKGGRRLAGALLEDLEEGRQFEVQSRIVINATGVFADQVRRLDDPLASPLLQPSQGIHLVLPSSFLSSSQALLLPRTEDRRVLFAIPWRGRVLLGTTDTPRDSVELEPSPRGEEIDYLLRHARLFLQEVPRLEDVLSIFCGIRPLLRRGSRGSTSRLSREYGIVTSPSGLLTVLGGKWTTYRQMARQAVDRAQTMASLPPRPCRTHALPLHGWTRPVPPPPWDIYGADAPQVLALARQRPELLQPLHPRLPYRNVQVIWAVRREMARTLEDVLVRRLRCLVLDARASLEVAESVARLMARERRLPESWVRQQVESFRKLLPSWLPPDTYPSTAPDEPPPLEPPGRPAPGAGKT